MKEYLDKLNDSSTRENSFQQLKTIITKYTSIEQVKIILPILSMLKKSMDKMKKFDMI